MNSDLRLAERIEEVLSSDKASRESKARKTFQIVRDIPFAIRPELFDISSAEMMLQFGEGFCIPKHILLGRLYLKMGLAVKWDIMAFRWDRVKLPYSEDLKELAGELPETYHLALETDLGQGWILIDATWDAGLKGAGVPVNLAGELKSSMAPAVVPQARYEIPTERLAGERLDELTGKYALSDKLQLARFGIEMNKFLKRLRGELKGRGQKQ